MTDHIVIDASRQPSQIRCLGCGFAQDMDLPMSIDNLFALERQISARHRGCKPRQIAFTEGNIQRGNGNGGPGTEKPVINPMGQVQP